MFLAEENTLKKEDSQEHNQQFTEDISITTILIVSLSRSRFPKEFLTKKEVPITP
jgi:hypothetical protein